MKFDMDKLKEHLITWGDLAKECTNTTKNKIAFIALPEPIERHDTVYTHIVLFASDKGAKYSIFAKIGEDGRPYYVLPEDLAKEIEQDIIN